jgi:hypothetical protein
MKSLINLPNKVDYVMLLSTQKVGYLNQKKDDFSITLQSLTQLLFHQNLEPNDG